MDFSRGTQAMTASSASLGAVMNRRLKDEVNAARKLELVTNSSLNNNNNNNNSTFVERHSAVDLVVLRCDLNSNI